MKTIFKAFLVLFLANNAIGQNVDPETFPNYTGSLSGINLYSNTGGEKKISIDSLKGYSNRFTLNGLTYDGDTKLGGNLIQNTNIDLDNHSMLFLNSPLSAFGSYPFGSMKQYVMIQDLNNHLGTISISYDTLLGQEKVTSGISNINLVNNNEIGFFTHYDLNSNSQYTFWKRKSTTGGGELNIKLEPIDGAVVSPFGDGGSNPFTGSNIFVVKNTLGGDIFKITNADRINQSLPSYADDADAGANGLISGDTYQTSGTGASPLNVAGILMVKQ